MRPCSEDLRERAVQRAEAGETIREIAAALRISPSCVSKWRKRQRETGSLAPDQVGGHKPRTLVGEHAEWVRARVAEGPFTTRGLTAELAARGIKTDRRAVWVFLHAEGLSFEKKRCCPPSNRALRPKVDQRTHRLQARPLAGSSGQDRPRAGWSSSMRPGSRPTWRRCAAGACVGNGWMHACRTGIGRRSPSSLPCGMIGSMRPG